MKDKCDNHCETCPMQTQIHCILIYSKATNESIGALDERIKAIEEKYDAESTTMINPFVDKESVILPTQETGADSINTIKQ